MEIKASHKSSDLSSILYTHFGKEMNFARIRFFALFICALCKVQTVCFEKLSLAFDSGANSTSSLRRIQRFMAKYMLDTNLIAKLIFSLLPHKPPYTLSIDRTNWKFGEANINALVIAITYDGVAFPIVYTLLPKRGNSDTKERIQLIDRFIALFGVDTIGYLVADREFVGQEWMKYLNTMQIKYHIRIKGNFYVRNPRDRRLIKVSRLFSGVKINQHKYLDKIYYLKEELCYLSASCIKNKEGIPELQIIASFNEPEKAQKRYKERWQIESAFRAIKSSGFNIEDTHLRDIERIEKLFALVFVAFTWAYITGLHIHYKVKHIRICKHGRKARSFFKCGLNTIAGVLLNQRNNTNIDVFNFLSCT